MAQVLLEGTEQDRIEVLVAKFDPASRPGPLRDKLSGDDLEIMREYVAGLIRARVSAELLARASEGLLEPADELANPFEEAMRAVVWRHMDEGVGEAAWELAWAARDAMFSKP